MSNSTTQNTGVFFTQCRGHYIELLKYFFPMCSQLLTHIGRHAPDPFRGGSKDGARLDKDFNNSGKLFFNQNIWGHQSPCISFFELMQLTGIAQSKRDAFVKIGQYLGFPEYCHEDRLSKAEWFAKQRQLKARSEELERQAQKELEEESKKARSENEEMWKHSVPLFKNGKPNPDALEVWKYFETRGLGGLKYVNPLNLRSLRCHKQLEYVGEGKNLKFDALIARVQDENGYGLNLHRTYLRNGRKADVGCPKKLTPADRRVTSKSRYICIGEPKDGVICIAEGIETALSCYLATGIGCYSCVNAQNIKSFVLPHGCHTVLIFADKDKSRTGEIVARELVDRIKHEHNGQQAFVVQPKQDIPENSKGIDWNDVIRSEGVTAFPDQVKIYHHVYLGLSLMKRNGR